MICFGGFMFKFGIVVGVEIMCDVGVDEDFILYG